jgi:hypothetical protein
MKVKKQLNSKVCDLIHQWHWVEKIFVKTNKKLKSTSKWTRHQHVSDPSNIRSFCCLCDLNLNVDYHFFNGWRSVSLLRVPQKRCFRNGSWNFICPRLLELENNYFKKNYQVEVNSEPATSNWMRKLRRSY